MKRGENYIHASRITFICRIFGNSIVRGAFVQSMEMNAAVDLLIATSTAFGYRRVRITSEYHGTTLAS